MSNYNRLLIERGANGELVVTDASLFNVYSGDAESGSILITGSDLDVEVIR